MKPDKMSRAMILTELAHLKSELEKQYAVTRIGVFGSVARDQATPDSNIDIVVEMIPDLFKRAALKSRLESYFYTEVDVIRYWRGMNPSLKKRIDRDVCYV